MTDYLWTGDPTAISTAIFDTVTDPVTGAPGDMPKAGLSVIGPRVLDGVAYVNVRTDAVLTPPAGASVTGPELSAAVVGIWMPDTIAP